MDAWIYVVHNGAKVVYESKDGKTSKTFDALGWLAQLATHIPNRGEQADFAIVAYGYDG